MAMNTSSQSTVDHLNFITRELNRYIPIAFLVLGTIGNILNTMLFIRPLFQTNPCSIYFISGSIANCFSLYIGLITPFLGLYNLDPSQTSDVVCKIRFYLRFITITLSTWFILLACIDRFVSSSSNASVRMWSSLRVAKRIVCSATIICFIFPYTQVFYCYKITQKKVCSFETNTCKLLNDIILLFCNSGLPPMLMILFSVLTIRHVKNSGRMIPGHRRRDLQLIRILFIQVLILVSFATIVTAQKVYSSATMFKSKDLLAVAVDNLLNQIAIEVSYISNSTTFYIYSLTNKKYRQEVFHILSLLFRCQNIKVNPVQPVAMSRLNPNGTTRKPLNELYKSNITYKND